MWRNLALVAASLMLLVSGLVHGLWTDRWQPGRDVDDFIARLDAIPRDVGDWHGKDVALPGDQQRAARIDGYCYRRYQNATSRHTVTMLLVCGRAGPIAVHTPDVCFEGAGYRAAMKPAPFELTYGPEDAEAGLRTMRFGKEHAAFPMEIRVFWTWNDGSGWQAPENPRLAYAGRHALYKMYVLRETTDEDVRPEDDPCAEFLRQFLPEVDAALGLTP